MSVRISREWVRVRCFPHPWLGWCQLCWIPWFGGDNFKAIAEAFPGSIGTGLSTRDFRSVPCRNVGTICLRNFWLPEWHPEEILIRRLHNPRELDTWHAMISCDTLWSISFIWNLCSMACLFVPSCWGSFWEDNQKRKGNKSWHGRSCAGREAWPKST